jgi:uncharacterized coiled-coil DUF342 family protein
MATESTETTTGNLKQKLNQQIDTARQKLDGLKKDLAGLREEDVQAIQQKRDELLKRLDQRKDKAKKLQADISNWRKEKVAHTSEAIGSWRQKLEIQKLEKRAERAESYALDLVDVAAYDFEEAEQAILEAITARFDANVASSAPR